MVDWISKQVSARYTLDDASSKRVINQQSTVARSSHFRSVVALAIVLAALVIAITTFISVIPMLRLLWAAIVAIVHLEPLRCSYTDRTDDAANQVKVINALQVKHKRIEYRARLTWNYTLQTLWKQIILVLQNT